MLCIAICDDQLKELAILNTYLTEHLTARALEAEAKQYTEVRNSYTDYLMAKEVRR